MMQSVSEQFGAWLDRKAGSEWQGQVQSQEMFAGSEQVEDLARRTYKRQMLDWSGTTQNSLEQGLIERLVWARILAG